MGRAVRGAKNIAKEGLVTRRPWSYTRRNSARFNRRADLGKAALFVVLLLLRLLLRLGLLLGVADGSLVTDGELPPAFGPAPAEDIAAILGLHAVHEPVFFGALAVVRLKSALWHLLLPLLNKARGGQKGQQAHR